MFGWLKKLATPGAAPGEGAADDTPAEARGYALNLDGDEIAVTYPGQPQVKASLSDVAEVLVETSEEDSSLWWLLLGDRGNLLMNFPAGASGEDALVAKLRALPGFDEAKLDEALNCELSGEFVLWRRG